MNSGVKGLHPPVDPHVIHLDAAFGQQILDIAVEQAVAPVPAHRERDYLAREAVPAGAEQAAFELITRSVCGA
jgi:hypothetical protein